MNHLDMEQLNELKEVLEDEFQVLINTYLIDAQLRLKLIEEGLDIKNYEQVRLAAHSLKGASANIGALILAQLCEQLEHDCKKLEYQNLKDVCLKITKEIQLVRTLILQLH